MDGTLFIYKIDEYSDSNLRSTADDEKVDDNSNSIVDEALADIVLVKKHEMEEW